jgi:hypothetical protein
VRRLDLADRLLDRAGERALLVAEELALEQVLRDRGAVDRDEALAAARRLRVQVARQDLLAGARLAEEQHRGVGRRHALDRPAHPHHLGIPREDAAERLGALRRLEPAVLLLQVVQAEGALDDEGQELRLERLRVEVVRAKPDRLHRVRAVVLAGEDDHLRVGEERERLLQASQALGRLVRRGREPEVHRRDRRLEAAQLRERTLAVVRDDRLVLIERPAHLLLQRRVVLDDQQRPALFGRRCAHGLTLALKSAKDSRLGRPGALTPPPAGRSPRAARCRRAAAAAGPSSRGRARCQRRSSRRAR